jgi:alpha-L-rhamnosidase
MRSGPILESDFQMGEHYDARLELGDWNSPAYDDAAWDAVKVFDAPDIAITAHIGPPVRPQEELTPLEKPKLHDHKYIFDMGQNMVGRVRLKVSGEKGTTVRLRFAEILNKDGSIYTENLRQARATDYYTLKGEGEETWEPRFTFHGFRYVELSGLKEAPDENSVTGIVLNSDITRTGEWHSNDALLNQLQSNIWWGQKGNFLEVPDRLPATRRAFRLDRRCAGFCTHLPRLTPTSRAFLPSGSATSTTRNIHTAACLPSCPTPRRWPNRVMMLAPHGRMPR